MPIPVYDGIVKEMRAQPYSMIALLALLLVVPYIWQHAAWADDLRAVQGQLTSLSVTVIKGNLEQQLRQVETELFSLQQKVKEKEILHQAVDPLNYGRINDLQIEKGQIERQLAALR